MSRDLYPLAWRHLPVSSVRPPFPGIHKAVCSHAAALATPRVVLEGAGVGVARPHVGALPVTHVLQSLTLQIAQYPMVNQLVTYGERVSL